MREAVGQATLDKALAFDPSITDRAKTSMLQRTARFSYDMGIHILSVQLERRYRCQDAVQDAQRDAIKADKDRQRYQQEAELYRNDVTTARAWRSGEATLFKMPRLISCRCSRFAQGETARFDQVLDAIRSRPGGDARTHVSRDHGAMFTQELAQGHRRCQERQQHDVSAAGQA